tara:strand:+ start:136 stop:870 length:735 start_codon:yes stop_codon:yes gene_type:complete
MGFMIGTMSFFMYIFANGTESVENLSRAFEIAVIVGSSTALVFLSYTSVRYVERNRRLAEKKLDIDPLDRLQNLFASVEDKARSLPWADESPWTAMTHVRRDRGVLTVDLHDLDLPLAKLVIEQVIVSREWLGRVRIITGRGLHSKTIPKLRPMVTQRLRAVVNELNWELLMKKGSVTLRPIGEAPTFKKWLLRLIFLGSPITLVFAFAFRDLAGEGAYDQGLKVGIILGLVLSGMLASYRERQ